jgi:hypothetical protein
MWGTGEARARACVSSDRYELRTFTVRSIRNGYLYTRGGCLRTRGTVSAKRAFCGHLSRRMVSIRGCHSQARGTALAAASYSHDGTSLLCSDGELIRERLHPCGTLCLGDRLSIARGTALFLSSHIGSASQYGPLAGRCHAVKPGISVRRTCEHHAETRCTITAHALMLEAHTSGTVFRHPRKREHRRA